MLVSVWIWSIAPLSGGEEECQQLAGACCNEGASDQRQIHDNNGKLLSTPDDMRRVRYFGSKINNQLLFSSKHNLQTTCDKIEW